jgi:hypothetical protein
MTVIAGIDLISRLFSLASLFSQRSHLLPLLSSCNTVIRCLVLSNRLWSHNLSLRKQSILKALNMPLEILGLLLLFWVWIDLSDHWEKLLFNFHYFEWEGAALLTYLQNLWAIMRTSCHPSSKYYCPWLLHYQIALN